MGLLLNIIKQMEVNNLEGKLNASLTLIDLFNSGKNYGECFEKPEFLQAVFDLIRSDDDITVRSALQMLDAIFTKFPYYGKGKSTADEDPFKSLSFFDNSRNNDEPIDEKINKVIIDNIGDVEHIIINYEIGSWEVTYAQEAKQFGYTRIQAIKVMKALIKWGSVDYAVGFNNSFSSLLQFCKDHPWNSVLHKLTEEIYAEVLRTNSGYPEDYKTVFLEETRLDQFIPELESNSTFDASQR